MQKKMVLKIKSNSGSLRLVNESNSTCKKKFLSIALFRKQLILIVLFLWFILYVEAIQILMNSFVGLVKSDTAFLVSQNFPCEPIWIIFE